MNCPKCGTQLETNYIKCPVCGARIGRLCPSCKGYNLITSKTCSACGETLLKVCPSCQSVNLPSSKLCRKCGADLESKKIVIPEENIETVVYNANYSGLASAQKIVLEAISNPNIKIISLNGTNEHGKSYVFRKLMRNTSELQIAWLMGKCTPHTQLTPLGYIQSVLLNLFNVTNFCSSKKQLKRESVKFFKQDFSNLETREIYDLLNIMYPENIDVFANIHVNKQNTIKIIIKIFETILAKMNAVLLVENIEYIDNLSYEILGILLENDFIREKLTIIISGAKEQSGINCLTSPVLKEDNYSDVTLAPNSKEQLDYIFNEHKDSAITSDIKKQIIKHANSNPTLVEHLIYSTLEALEHKRNISFKDDLESVLKLRLETLKVSDNCAYLVLCAISILGVKFHPIILTGFMNMSVEDIDTVMKKLSKLGYIVPCINFGYEFKSLYVWNIIIKLLKEDTEIFKDVNKVIYPLVSAYTLSTSAILGFIAQNLNASQQAYMIWSACAQLAAYIGDTGLYIILQKQILSIMDSINIEQADGVKCKIYSELGKLLEPDNPQLAMEYLPKAVVMYNDTQFIEKIELLGYLASASMKLKNYQGVIECINTTIPLIPTTFSAEIALLKSREIKALFELGNTGSIINTIDNDIIPVFEAVLNGKTQCKTISQDIIFNSWLKTLLYLAKSLIYQGDSRAFNVLHNLREVCKVNNIENQDFLIDIDIYRAFAYTISGDVRTSIGILDDILSQMSDSINEYAMSTINLISVLNRFFMNKNDLSYEELFQAAQYADDINDDFTKNILKLILGRLMQDRTSAKEAMNIYTKQVEYFAEKQNAVGVLLGWYFISEAKMLIDGPKAALDVAMKALDVAQSANIANHYFVLLLNKLIAEIYLTLQDYDASKMHIEKAVTIAKSLDIKYQLVNLYILYGKYLQDIALTTQDKKADYVLSAQEMNKKAGLIAESLKLVSQISKVERANTVLNSFCQINGIVLK